MKIPLMLIFLAFSSAFLAGSEIDLGSPETLVFEVLGEPDEIIEKKDHNGVFQNLFYKIENTTYTIDKAKGIVCEISHGNTPSTCYPCSGENGADLCI